MARLPERFRRRPAQDALRCQPRRKITGITAPTAFSRRDFLALAATGRIFGPEFQRYSDPATEFPVLRLTSPAFASGFTAPHLSQFTRRGELLHWSDRSGSTQGYLLDLKTGQSRQLTEAAALDRASLALSPDEKTAYYFDGANLNEATHNRPIYQATAERRGMTVATDGSILFAEGNKLIRLFKQKPAPVAEDEGIDLVMARPRQTQLLYRSKDSLFLLNLDGTGKRALKLEPGQTGEILWTPAGRSLIYLHIPDDPKQLLTLRENLPDENSDHEIARTSQFAAVNANADASVFTGASRGKASAYVLILLRVTRRELTLCEHRASDANMVSPLFTPDSQSVLFVSDRHGKPALYQVKVEKFVEPTM